MPRCHFDLRQREGEPCELCNLIGFAPFADVTRTLHEKLERALEKIGEPHVPTDPAPERCARQRLPELNFK